MSEDIEEIIEEPSPMKVEITNKSPDKPEYNQYNEIENQEECANITEEQIKEFLEESKDA